MRHAIVMLVVGLFLPASLFAQASPALTLRPDWEVGQTSRYAFSTTREQATTISAGGRTQTLNTSIESRGEATWRVEQTRPDGSYLCAMTLDWMAVTLTAPNGESRTADSRKASGEPPPLQQVVKALAGVPLTVTVNPDGSIAGVTGMQAMKARVPDPELVPDELDFIESASDMATLPFVPAEIPVGGSWPSTFRWTHDLGHLNYKTNWQVTGVEDVDGVLLAGVTATARMTLDLDRSQIPPDANVDIRLSAGQHDAQILYDLARDEAVARNVLESRTFDFTIRFPQGTMTRKLVETVKSQTYRIAEE